MIDQETVVWETEKRRFDKTIRSQRITIRLVIFVVVGGSMNR